MIRAEAAKPNCRRAQAAIATKPAAASRAHPTLRVQHLPEHSSDSAACHPLQVEILAPREGALEGWQAPARNGYDRSHGR